MSCVDMELEEQKKSLLSFFCCINNIIKEIEYKRQTKGCGWWVFKRIENYIHNLFYASMWIFFSIVNPFFCGRHRRNFNFHCSSFIFCSYHWWQIWPIFYCNKNKTLNIIQKQKKSSLVSLALHIKKRAFASKMLWM